MSNISGTLTISGTTIAGTLTTAETVINGTVSTPGASITGTLNIGVGPKGDNGDSGVGVPAGGGPGQLLAKVDATDYNTDWVDAPTGGGGGFSPIIFSGILQNATTTLVDIPGMTVTIPASGLALLRFTVAYWGGSAENVKIKFTQTSGGLKRGLSTRARADAFGYLTEVNYLEYNLAAGGFHFFFAPRVGVMELYVENNAAETTLQIQMAQLAAGTNAADIRHAVLEAFIS